MLLTILILLCITAVMYLILPLVYDIISAPFNYGVSKGILEEAHFGIPYKPKWYSIVLFFLVLLIASYLFIGISMSYMDWATARHQDSVFIKIFSVSLGTSISLSLRQKSIKMISQEPVVQYVPSILAALWIPRVVALFIVLILIFPKLDKYWSWFPYVH